MISLCVCLCVSVSVCVPVRCPLIILSCELKSCLYFSREDWGTAQSQGGRLLGQTTENKNKRSDGIYSKKRSNEKKILKKERKFKFHIFPHFSWLMWSRIIYLTYPAASKDATFCSFALERLNEVDLLTGWAERDRKVESFSQISSAIFRQEIRRMSGRLDLDDLWSCHICRMQQETNSLCLNNNRNISGTFAFSQEKVCKQLWTRTTFILI